MKVQLKYNVKLLYIDDLMMAAVEVVYAVYTAHGLKPIMTSGSDGNHSENSYHYSGLAWDWRVYQVKGMKEITEEIKRALKKIDPYYDTVYDRTKKPLHLHIEYDVRRKARDGRLKIKLSAER